MSIVGDSVVRKRPTSPFSAMFQAMQHYKCQGQWKDVRVYLHLEK